MNFAQKTIVLMIVTMLGKALGFVKEQFLASSYGATAYSDAYLVSLNIPLVIFSSIAVALATSYIPVFSSIRSESGEREANRFTNNLINIVAIICIIFSILGMVFTEQLVKIFAMGFEGETLQLAITFTRIMMFGIAFIGINDILSPYLQVHDNFAVPGLLGIPYNIIVISSILLSLKYGINVLVIGTVVAIISKVVVQLPFAMKIGYRYKPILSFKDKDMKRFMYLVAPVFIGVGVNQINGLVDRTLASTLAEGSISSLNYANKLNEFIMAMFIASITTVLYPTLVKIAHDRNQFIKWIVKSINSVILLIMPISVGAIILSKPIIRVLFERGAFTERDTNMTAIALVFYSIGLIGLGVREVLSRIFYSLHDTKTPMINGTIAMGCNIVLNIVLIKYMKFAGLAFATSLSSIICTVLLFINLRRKIGKFGLNKIVIVFGKSAIAACIMAVGVSLSYNYILGILGSGLIQQLLSLFISVGIGGIVYLSSIVVFRISEVEEAIEFIKGRIVKNR